MKNRKLKLFLTLLVSLNWFTVGCGLFGTTTTEEGDTGNNETPVSDEVLRLGALFPTTGDLASLGANMPVAAQLAVDTVNACGGVNGNQVTLIKEDDQTDPVAGSEAMTKLTEVDRVHGVVGSFASSVSTAALDVAVRNKVMLISPGSTSPVFTERAQNGEFNGFWARTAPSDSYQAPALAALARQKGFQNVSTVVINNDYGVGFEQKFHESFKDLGGTILNETNPVRYDPKATTLDTEAASAFANNPDGVAAIVYAETGSLLLQSAFKQGLMDGVTVLLTDGVYSDDFGQQMGKKTDGTSIVEGALGTIPGADGEALGALRALWQEKIGTEISAFVPHSWDATVLLMLAAQSAGSNNGQAIRDNIKLVSSGEGTPVSDPCQALELLKNGEQINYQGASGNVDIDDNGDVIGVYDVWTVNADGSLEVIDTIAPIIQN